MILAPDTSTSIVRAVGAASVSFGAAMADGQVWLFASSAGAWIRQGAGVAASAANGSTFVPAGVVMAIDGACGPDLAVIEAGAGGTASLTMARRL
jgi:hypothetical protein